MTILVEVTNCAGRHHQYTVECEGDDAAFSLVNALSRNGWVVVHRVVKR